MVPDTRSATCGLAQIPGVTTVVGDIALRQAAVRAHSRGRFKDTSVLELNAQVLRTCGKHHAPPRQPGVRASHPLEPCAAVDRDAGGFLAGLVFAIRDVQDHVKLAGTAEGVVDAAALPDRAITNVPPKGQVRGGCQNRRSMPPEAAPSAMANSFQMSSMDDDRYRTRRFGNRAPFWPSLGRSRLEVCWRSALR